MKMNCVAFAISGQKNSLEAAMRYQKANEILPKELVELIQSYMDFQCQKRNSGKKQRDI